MFLQFLDQKLRKVKLEEQEIQFGVYSKLNMMERRLSATCALVVKKTLAEKPIELQNHVNSCKKSEPKAVPLISVTTAPVSDFSAPVSATSTATVQPQIDKFFKNSHQNQIKKLLMH